MTKIEIDDFPEWAVQLAVYGYDDNTTEEDEAAYYEYVESLESNCGPGRLEFPDSHPEFDMFPAFGKGANVVPAVWVVR